MGAAINEWKAEHGDVRSVVFHTLDAHVEQIIAGAIGFERCWSNWEVDHCNGREPLVGQLLTEAARKHVAEWLGLHYTKLPKKTAVLAKHLAGEFNRSFERHLRDRLGELARRFADAEAERLMAEALAQGMEGQEGKKE